MKKIALALVLLIVGDLAINRGAIMLACEHEIGVFAHSFADSWSG